MFSSEVRSPEFGSAEHWFTKAASALPIAGPIVQMFAEMELANRLQTGSSFFGGMSKERQVQLIETKNVYKMIAIGREVVCAAALGALIFTGISAAPIVGGICAVVLLLFACLHAYRLHQNMQAINEIRSEKEGLIQVR